ncbi:family 43 glycosylhydrolase [Glycomyces algeriensis]|uniref:family 43 glycosylhydrolase n=1 Tax=Glycomyces algeriensis TaxID=256037 RepID=UPI0022D7FADA|nr:family 43 glycosylhydrolase [Glycomyces algeriensis]MDA1368582.1 family 43 glycosylhydrolase [Glycomyces algeriensis]MDR7352381.1 arabinan endo-1,5-alpha-L-arabinosidase [Glycomyces algeriensis]
MRQRRITWIAGLAAAVIAATGLAFLAPTASHAAIDTNADYVLTSRHSGLVLDINGASTAENAGLIQWNRNDATNQRFRLIDAGGGYYRVQSRHSGKVLGLQNQSTADGANVVQETDANATDQQWRVTESGGYATFVNRLSGKALDVWEWSTAAGGRISQYTATGGTNQQWSLTALGTGNPGQTDCASGPTQPPSIGGTLGAHDPALWAGCTGQPWFAYATGDGRFGGGTPPIFRSTNGGQTWQNIGTMWNAKPAWTTQQIPGVDNLWAPEIHYDAVQGLYYVYYSASTFGSQRSAIGVATSPTLDPSASGYGWTDRGAVIQSYEGSAYNAIDPSILVDASGRHWMVFGSWWQGIHIVELDWPSGKVKAGATPIRLATKSGGIEGPAMMQHDGYYYLFTSIGTCCAGANSTYKITVGRSTSPTGPFVDAAGVDMRNGGGTVLLGAYGTNVAAGGQSLHRGFIAYHSYGTNGGFALDIEQIQWNSAGWPVLNGS